ncbi:hypothetical protein U0070_022824 [Myodes glareolus]|uniref:non-specific serine/threonine protein kinase n=1 Tax=Myodes glareolus TaxID=447135 RepID=A0AAW0K7F0_MYOGA
MPLGGLGTVALACHRHVYTLVAMKMVENDNEHLHLVMTEVAVLKMIKNLHIICLSQILRTESYTFKGMEAAMTAHGTVHRDMKPDSILLDAEGNVKLGDFGLATRSGAGTVLQGCCGTEIYNAPELVLRKGYDGRKADIWSLGIEPPRVRGRTLKETKKNTNNGTCNIPVHISGQLKFFINQILTVALNRRPSIRHIQQHPWVKNSEGNIPSESKHPDPVIVDMLLSHGSCQQDLRLLAELQI